MAPRTGPAVLAATLLVAVAAIAAPAPAANPPNRVEAGLRVASEYCGRCHVVVPGKGRGWTDAPSFAAIANNPATTSRAIRDFLQKPHMHMLAYNEGRRHAGEIAAYIMSLRRR